MSYALQKEAGSVDLGTHCSLLPNNRHGLGIFSTATAHPLVPLERQATDMLCQMNILGQSDAILASKPRQDSTARKTWPRRQAWYGQNSRHSKHVFVGMARMRHTLQALQAQAQAAIALEDGGPAALVQSLISLLPPLANSGKPSSSFCF